MDSGSSRPTSSPPTRRICRMRRPSSSGAAGRRSPTVHRVTRSSRGGWRPQRGWPGAGAVVGLGTDGACCNNGMDLFEEMKVAGLLNKVAAGDPAALPAIDILRAATSEAARVLGVDHLVGSLEPGKRADVIAVRMGGSRVMPWHDPIANLVYAARGSDVTAVFVDGRLLCRDGAPVRLDPERVLADGARAARRLADGPGRSLPR